jgi:hypothetical protein
MFEQSGGGTVQPVHVLEDHHRRPQLRHAGEILAGGAVDLPAHGLAVQRSDLLGEFFGKGYAKECPQVRQDFVSLLTEESPHPEGQLGPTLAFRVFLLDVRVLMHDLKQRPVADAPAKRQRLSFQPRNACLLGLDLRFGDQAGLPEAGFADQKDDSAFAFAQSRESPKDGGEFGFPADER